MTFLGQPDTLETLSTLKAALSTQNAVRLKEELVTQIREWEALKTVWLPFPLDSDHVSLGLTPSPVPPSESSYSSSMVSQRVPELTIRTDRYKQQQSISLLIPNHMFLTDLVFFWLISIQLTKQSRKMSALLGFWLVNSSLRFGFKNSGHKFSKSLRNKLRTFNERSQLTKNCKVSLTYFIA